MSEIVNLTNHIIPTLNKMGYSTKTLNEYCLKGFVNYIKQSSGSKILEIGSGYGAAAKFALEAGSFVTANDLESRHLNILKKSVSKDLLSRLTLKIGKFPQDLNFSDNNFDAILISQVIHFLKAEEIEAGLPLLKNWLKPCGKIFITAISPYIGVLKEFLPVYQLRKLQGLAWPGQIENLKEYCDHFCTDHNPDFIHVFELEILQNHLIKAGFKIEEAHYYSIQEHITDEFKNDGREYIGIIASKS